MEDKINSLIDYIKTNFEEELSKGEVQLFSPPYNSDTDSYVKICLGIDFSIKRCNDI